MYECVFCSEPLRLNAEGKKRLRSCVSVCVGGGGGGLNLRPLIIDNKLLILFAIPRSLSEFLCGCQILIAI